MGKQSNQSRKIGFRFPVLLIMMTLIFSSCSRPSTGDNNSLIEAWVKQKYAIVSKVTISQELSVSFPDIQAYRGSFMVKNKQRDGLFFVNKKDRSVSFLDASQNSEDK